MRPPLQVAAPLRPRAHRSARRMRRASCSTRPSAVLASPASSEWAEIQLAPIRAQAGSTARRIASRALDEFFRPLERARCSARLLRLLDRLHGERQSDGTRHLLGGKLCAIAGHSLWRRPVSFTVPFTMLLRSSTRPSVRALHQRFHWRRALQRTDALVQVGYESFFYPLDGLRKWNRIYGAQRAFSSVRCSFPGSTTRGRPSARCSARSPLQAQAPFSPCSSDARECPPRPA